MQYYSDNTNPTTQKSNSFHFFRPYTRIYLLPYPVPHHPSVNYSHGGYEYSEGREGGRKRGREKRSLYSRITKNFRFTEWFENISQVHIQLYSSTYGLYFSMLFVIVDLHFSSEFHQLIHKSQESSKVKKLEKVFQMLIHLDLFI